MKNFKLFLLAILAISVGFLSSCSDDNSTVEPALTVSGTVSDDLGNPLEGASVTSVDDDSKSVTTAADGTYSISVIETDQLIFGKDGYVSVTLSAVASLDATLTRGPGAMFAESFANTGNTVADPAFAAGSIQPTGSLGAAVNLGGNFFSNTAFKGAVDPSGTPWYAGWSFYERLLNGETNSAPLSLGNIVNVTDGDLPTTSGMSVTWTNNNTYVLDGFVFVSEGVTLNIEAGTIIQGKSGEAENASALIVTRGGKINAMGTADAPIIFTYEGDQGGTSAATRGQWGGLIILGRATLNSSPGESAIEGLPTNDSRGLYGGNIDDDNSGNLSYISIRHGGTLIGGDNEINGLTLGGVGNGTSINYVEVIGNRDDGIEWFGGTVNGKYLISAFCADDGLDYDEGYLGNNQFVIVHQDSAPDAADRGGEHDGGTDPETGTPYATPKFVNVTSIGNPNSRTITFRDNAGGEYHNSIFTGYGRGIDVEDLENQDQDSYKQWQDGLLKLENNVFFNIGAGDKNTDIFKVSN